MSIIVDSRSQETGSGKMEFELASGEVREYFMHTGEGISMLPDQGKYFIEGLLLAKC